MVTVQRPHSAAFFPRIVGAYFFLVGFFLAGCASISSTQQYYFPTEDRRYPPQPEDTVIPILAAPPQRAFHVIGKFAMETSQDIGFLRKSMEFNARRNGADAVVIRKLTSHRIQWMEEVPPRWEMMPVTRQVCTQGHHHKKKETFVVDQVPVFQPGYLRPREKMIHSLQAEMVVYRSHDTQRK